ncbi:MAG: hypothetical protein K2L11_09775 [Muribaculaceae bacterium]|nr:hypothetical protein [Muribaculaceae bacterium]
MKHYENIFTYVVILGIYILGINKNMANDMTTSAPSQLYMDRIEMQRSIYPQEKIHMVTDRDIYIGGDTVWFRIFIVDAATHRQISISKYTYVELINPFGNVQNRIKVMERDGIYKGYLPIDPDIYEGQYTIAVYTTFAENQGQDYFFKKPLKLLSRHRDKISVETQFFSKGDSITEGILRLNKSNGSKMHSRKVSYIMPNGKYIEHSMNHDFKRDYNLNDGENVILVKYGDYGKFIPIEDNVTPNINLAFYPEGGWLIEGVPCKIAFKATDANGKGINASGIIRDNDGEWIADFKTSHNGMGSVVFIPEDEKTYIAEYYDIDKKKHAVEIGSSKMGAAALRYTSTGTKSTFSVVGGQNKTYDLVIACRANGLFSFPISSGQSFSIDKSELPSGLYQAMLVSPNDSAVISERFFFIGADRLSQKSKTLTLSPDSTTIKLTAEEDKIADCCLRILGQNGQTNENGLNIYTQILLQSELRGRIENPGYYFRNPNKETEQNLDLLMMVNGWCRYNLPDALFDKFVEPTIPIEIGQEISGHVQSLRRNKPFAGTKVLISAPNEKFVTESETDESGHFCLNGFDFPENTRFILQTVNKNGNPDPNYEIFTDNSFPTIDKLNEHLNENQELISYISRDIHKNRQRVENSKYKFPSGAEIYGLDMYEYRSSYSCTDNDFKARGISTIEEAMSAYPGISTINGNIKFRNKYVAFYLDGKFFQPAPNASSGFGKGPTISELNELIPFEDIERIDFLKPEDTSILNRTYGGAAIMIITKHGNKTSWQKQTNIKNYIPLGYQKYKEYASPILTIDTDVERDQSEQTLLWLPSVKFDDEGETIELKNPVKTGYRLILEGIDENGDFIYESF